MFAGVAHTR